MYSEKLKNLVSLIDGDRGKNYPKKTDYFDDGYCLYLSTKNVRQMGFKFDSKVYISKEKHLLLNNGTLKRNDLVLTTRGTIGNIAFYSDVVEHDIVRINSGMVIIRIYDFSILYPQYLMRFIQSPEFIAQIIKNKSGTAQPQLPIGVLNNFDIPIFSLKEQKRIVKKTDKLFSNLDNSDKYLVHLEKQLKRYRQSVLKSAFEGELTLEWRKKQTNIESTNKILEDIKSERINYIEQQVKSKFLDKTDKWLIDKVKKEVDKFYTNLKPIGDEEIPYNIPNEWSWVRLDELSKKITDGTHFTPTYVSEGISFISVKDIRNKKINFENCKYISKKEHLELYKRCNPENNDVLITKSGTIGRSCVVNVDRDFSLFVSVALIKPFLNLLNPYYLMYRLDNYIFMTDIQQTIKGGVIKNLHIVDMRQLIFPLFSLLEQNEIVKAIEKHFSIIDKLETVVQKSIKESKRLRQSILKQAFEGKLVEQDSNEESAEILLEKIAKAKEEYKKALKRKKK